METTTMPGAKLAAAMVKVQASLKGARKVKENPHLRSKYADLGSVWEACHEALTENAIAVIQAPAFENGAQFLDTILMHESGESIRGRYLINPVKNDPQGYGSAVTYARRYSLAAMVGIIQEDDDGQRASTRGPSAKGALEKVKSAVSGKDATISEKEQKDLFDSWKRAGRTDEEVKKYLSDTWGISSTREIKVKDLNVIIAWVKSSKR